MQIIKQQCGLHNQARTGRPPPVDLGTAQWCISLSHIITLCCMSTAHTMRTSVWSCMHPHPWPGSVSLSQIPLALRQVKLVKCCRCRDCSRAGRDLCEDHAVPRSRDCISCYVRACLRIPCHDTMIPSRSGALSTTFHNCSKVDIY